MKRTLVLLLFVVLFSCLQAKDSYRVGMTEWIPWVTLNVAEEKGFWKEQGLDVKVVMYDDYFNVSALNSGEIDFSIDLIGAWHSQIAAGKDITILSENDWSNGGDYFVERPTFDKKDKVIYTYADKLGGLIFIDKVLESRKQSIKDYKIARFDPGYMNSGYKKGNMNMIMSYEPDVLEIIESGANVVATTRDFPGIMPDGIAVMTDNLKTIPKKDLIKFFKGIAKAHDWVGNAKNKKEMYDIIRKKTLHSRKDLSDKEISDMLKNVLIYNRKELYKNNSPSGNLKKYSNDMSKFYKNMYGKEIDFYSNVNTEYIIESLK